MSGSETAERRCGNVAALREALEKFLDLARRGLAFVTSYRYTEEENDELEEAFANAKSALSKPARNCDVGTADEQIKRFMHYCDSRVCGRRTCACGYEELFRHMCAIKWAQMPYEGDKTQGETDEGK